MELQLWPGLTCDRDRRECGHIACGGSPFFSLASLACLRVEDLPTGTTTFVMTWQDWGCSGALGVVGLDQPLLFSDSRNKSVEGLMGGSVVQ